MRAPRQTHPLGKRNALRTLLAMMVLACGCSGKTHEGPQPVPECQEYEARLVRCTGVKSDIATQPAARASTEAERAQLKDLCLQNIAQLNQTCR